MPPARQDSALSEAESKRLREELKNTRDRVGVPPRRPAAPAGNAGGARNP